MKTFVLGLVALNVLAFGGVAQVHAKDGDPLVPQAEFAARAQKAEALAERVRRVHTYGDKVNKLANSHGNWERRGPTANIPELDPRAAGAAIALLIGGAFVLVDRRKRLAV
jgi:hypothetical protein